MDSPSAVRRPPSGPSRPTRWAVAGVLAVIVALTAGWPLADQALDDDEDLRDGAVLVLGPGDDTAELRVVGEGWVLSKAGSDPANAYALSRDGVDFVAGYVDPPLDAGADQLWDGLRQIQSATDSDSRLGPPSPATSAGGAAGVTGALSRNGRAGPAYVWVAPGRDYAVEITVLALPDADTAARADGAALARSLAFPGALS